MTTIEPRMANPAQVLPDAFKGIGSLLTAVAKGGVPTSTLELVALRASQLNGCSACVQGHLDALQGAGESVDRFVAQGITELGERLGPILWQFMPTKKFDYDDFGGFLGLLPRQQDGLARLGIVPQRFSDWLPRLLAAPSRHRRLDAARERRRP